MSPFVAHLCRPAGPAACPLLEVFLPRRVTSVPYRGTALAQVLPTRWHPNDARKRTTLRRSIRARARQCFTLLAYAPVTRAAITLCRWAYAQMASAPLYRDVSARPKLIDARSADDKSPHPL